MIAQTELDYKDPAMRSQLTHTAKAIMAILKPGENQSLDALAMEDERDYS
jgi:hypothetical protein